MVMLNQKHSTTSNKLHEKYAPTIANNDGIDVAATNERARKVHAE